MFSSVEVPGSTSTTARGINNLGQIVWSFVDSSGTHAFPFNNGRFSTIDVPGSMWTIATGINNIGQIVGGYGSGGETGNHGFLLSNGVRRAGTLMCIAFFPIALSVPEHPMGAAVIRSESPKRRPPVWSTNP